MTASMPARSTRCTNDRGALIWVNRIDGRPRELIRYRPGAWSVDRDLATDEPTFRSGDRVLPLADCINVRAFGSTDRAPLTLAREAIAVALLMEQHAAKLFARGARPSGVLKLASKINEAALARIRKSWTDAHGGSENSGRTAILEEGAEWQALSFNSVDAQFLELRQFQIIEIARAFRVPPHMLFDLGRATWSNVEIARARVPGLLSAADVARLGIGAAPGAAHARGTRGRLYDRVRGRRPDASEHRRSRGRLFVADQRARDQPEHREEVGALAAVSGRRRLRQSEHHRGLA